MAATSAGSATSAQYECTKYTHDGSGWPVAMADGQPDPSWVYFVHSYWAEVADPADVAATCDYGADVTAAIERGRLWATQFHPEKSATNGLRLLESFVDSCR